MVRKNASEWFIQGVYTQVDGETHHDTSVGLVRKSLPNY